jgi:hypothetical protein
MMCSRFFRERVFSATCISAYVTEHTYVLKFSPHFASYCGYFSTMKSYQSDFDLGRFQMREKFLAGVAAGALIVGIAGPVAAADLPLAPRVYNKAPVLAGCAVSTWAGTWAMEGRARTAR